MEGDLAEGEEQLKSRPYQAQLEEIAIKKNTIIHLPTGSGKTFIAIRVITRFRAALQKPWGEGGKRTFFLVNTIPLVNQQRDVISKLCPVNGVAGYSGDDGVDYWDKRKWDAELTKHQVIVMTSQILYDMLTHSYIKIEDINLLIFDECHHAVDDHPMRMVMKHFEHCAPDDQPRVLGLTATLLNANVTMSKIQSTLRDLETTFHATIATVNELGEVLGYSTNPHEMLVHYNNRPPSAAALEAIDVLVKLQNMVISVKLPIVKGKHDVKLQRGQLDISIDPKKIVKAVYNMIASMIMFIQELGIFGGQLGITAYIILLERLKRTSLSKEEDILYKFTITHSTQARMILLAAMENDTGYDKIVKHSSDKVLQLLNVLKEYNPKVYEASGVILKVNRARKPLSGIIFTKQRFTAKILYNLLKEIQEANPEEFGFLKHDFIVGFNVNPMKSTREQHYLKKASQTALLKFGNKDLNCLISTSVIEEGVDIPQCLLVLRYDLPLEYRSYIQSKGRARNPESSFIMLIDKNDNKFLGQYQNFQKIEQFIQMALIGNTDTRNAPSSMDIQENLYDDDDDIPPFITPYGGRLSAVSAISLLNRYCSILAHDQFTTITPMWVLEQVQDSKGNSLQKITILMPIVCPIKESIEGTAMPNLKAAKRSAALKACIKLYECGELDAVTLLPRHGTLNFDEVELKSCFPNWPWNEKEEDENVYKAGTKSRRRKHEKLFPAYLKGSNDWKSDSQTFYLHIIKLKTKFEKPKNSRERALYDLLHRDEGFGFLTSKPLPKICDFPMFLTVGEVTTSIEMNYAVLALKKSYFEVIKNFHFFIFDQVLAIAKKFLVFDGKENCMYVVPVKGHNGLDIDWECLQMYTSIPPVATPSYEERKSMNVTRESYQYRVVTPWYRGTILPDRYIVSDVLEYMTPDSKFDTSSYGSYADYYANKYNLEILGPQDQPLLEVRNISTRMNCLMPRAATLNSLTDKQQKLISAMQGDDKPKGGFAEVFIPEYCIKYEFPGVLWYKAMLLPSIVHRIFMLLIAYELRQEIALATKYGQPHLMKTEEWAPIEVNLQVTIKALLAQIEEPTQVTAIDRINEPIDESTRRPHHVITMKESLYQLQKKKINKEYPWDEKMEPIDIERNISSVTVMDIECYDEFVSSPLNPSTSNALKSPPRMPTTVAILPPPLKYKSKIELISRKPTGRGPELKDVLAALTTINSGDTFNLERVETLGDAFLKFAASLYLFHKFPALNEGQLTSIKGRFIGNRNLYYAGEKVRLAGRMKVEQFSPRKDFLVPGFFAPKEVQDLIEVNHYRPTFLIGMQFSQCEALDGVLCSESMKVVRDRFDSNTVVDTEPIDGAQNAMQCYIRAQAVSDKSVADCVEALIGTYLLSGGPLAAIKVMEWLKVMPPQDKFSEMLKRRVPTALSDKKTTLENIHFLLNDSRKDVERIINYEFKDPSFILEALSHSSYIRNRVTRSYERLEFLGDAILDFLITSHIFENCRELKPGELTDLRSALVNNVTFAAYVVKLGLHKFICTQLNPSLDSAIIAFVEHQEQRDHEIVEDVLYLIDEEDCHIAEYVEVPKVLSDIFEALIGAIYLDSGGDLSVVWSVIYRIMCKEIENFSMRIPQQPVRVLYESIHACPKFGPAKVVPKDEEKIMIPITITKTGRQHTVFGFGRNKFQAKRAAAKLALKILGL